MHSPQYDEYTSAACFSQRSKIKSNNVDKIYIPPKPCLKEL